MGRIQRAHNIYCTQMEVDLTQQRIVGLQDTCKRLEQQIADSRLSIVSAQEQLEQVRRELALLGVRPEALAV